MSRKVLCFTCLSLWLATASITQADLIARWEFEGDLVDSVGNVAGTLVGDPQFAEGLEGQALEFDGDDRVLVEAYSPVTGANDRGITAWILPDEGMATTRGGIVSWGLKVSGRKWVIRLENLMLRCEINGGMVRADSAVMTANEWHHIGVVLANDGTPILGDLQFYVDGEPASHAGHTKEIDTGDGGFFEIGGDMESAATIEFIGKIDEVRIFDHALTAQEMRQVLKGGGPGLSSDFATFPTPDVSVADVPLDTSLVWEAGQVAATHDVYLGTVFDDVNDADRSHPMDVLVSQGQESKTYDPNGGLAYGQTYYWRVDEVNAAPDNTIYKGEVWSFTAEPYSIPIPGGQITPTASSSNSDFTGPIKTVDGSGLDSNMMHSTENTEMWLSQSGDASPWIQYEFDGVMQLDKILVWNSNTILETNLGWGVKDVVIEYSVNGTDWSVLPDANQLSRAPGSSDYDAYDEIEFGAPAKYVRLTPLSNWGGLVPQYGLSETQFYAIPVRARTPVPASGLVDVLPDIVASWRAGRNADQHVLSISTDVNAVIQGVAPSITASTNAVALASMDLQLGQTYYWRVDEVNEAETTPVWAGPVWSLSTSASLIVDDFESYSNTSPHRPFQAWLDGFGYSADEFVPVGHGGNGTGAGVGHDIWSLSSPYFGGQIMEGTIVKGGNLSMPLYFDNTKGSGVSEAEMAFAPAQDWTAHAIKSLSLNIYGGPDNSGQLYVKINNAKVAYAGLDDVMLSQEWISWDIDLSTVNTNLQSVTSLVLGVEGAGATGVIYIDDIHLNP